MSEPANSRNPNTTQQKILDAALSVFLEVGFDRANLDTIAAQAGVTKPTVYSHFGSKLGLLEAVARHQSELAIAQHSPNLQSTGNVRQDLVQFSRMFLSNIMHPASIRMHRFALVESIAHPELAVPLLNAGPQRILDVLQQYLAMETRNGRLRCKDTQTASQHLMGLLAGMDFLHVIITQSPPSDLQIKKRAASAVQVFLDHYGVTENQHES
ncbi:MAG: TetR/AcrR family transcriptional regulator [Pirellula sp.]